MTEGRKENNNRLTQFLRFFVDIIKNNSLSITASGITKSGTSSIWPFKNFKTSSTFSLFCLGALSAPRQTLRLYCSNSSWCCWVSLFCFLSVAIYCGRSFLPDSNALILLSTLLSLSLSIIFANLI